MGTQCSLYIIIRSSTVSSSQQSEVGQAERVWQAQASMTEWWLKPGPPSSTNLTTTHHWFWIMYNTEDSPVLTAPYTWWFGRGIGSPCVHPAPIDHSGLHFCCTFSLCLSAAGNACGVDGRTKDSCYAITEKVPPAFTSRISYMAQKIMNKKTKMLNVSLSADLFVCLIIY